MEKDELNGIMEYEYKRVEESGITDFGIKINIKDKKDYTKWELTLIAPDDSDYKDGKYIVDVEFLLDYPLVNPKFTFKTNIYHCNVEDNGELNVNWLMKGMKIDYILPRLLTLFYIQDPSVDENSEKCKLYKENIDKFKEKIKENVKAQQNNKN